MTTHTPEELHEIGQRAIARLDEWLGGFAKLDDPVEIALDDLGHELGELGHVANVECAHARKDCLDCVRNYVFTVGERYAHLRGLWEARA